MAPKGRGSRNLPRRESKKPKRQRRSKSIDSRPGLGRSQPEATFAEAAQRAITIVTHWTSEAELFTRRWAGFNVFYGRFTGGDRERIVSAVASGVTDDQAESILGQLSGRVDFYARVPPGDMLRPQRDAGFRRKAERDMQRATDSRIPAGERLGHFMAAIYQVRCNLVHGGKNAGDERSKELIGGANDALSLVLDQLGRNAAGDI